MKSFESVGKTIEEAVESGLRAMNLTKADVDIKIINKGNWFTKAKVLLTSTIEEEEKTLNTMENTQKNTEIEQKKEEILQNSNEGQVVQDKTFSSESVLEGQKKEENTPEIKNYEPKQIINKISNIDNNEKAKLFLTNLFEKMNIKAEIEIEEQEMATVLQVKTENANILIGRHGETMQAMQTMINILINSKKEDGNYKKILIDIENYRKKQDEKIAEQTKKAIDDCLQKAKPISLNFMNAYERHIVHDLVTEDGRVVSESFGKDPRRFVKIFIK